MGETNNSGEFSAVLLGKNLKFSREARGRSLQDVSRLLGIPTNRLKKYETGQATPSLPETEALSFIYQVPMFSLLEEGHLPGFIHDPDEAQLSQLLRIRQHIIATRLQIARENTGISYRELGKKTSIPVSRLKRYETGLTAIPFDELKQICLALAIPVEDLMDTDSPVGAWQHSQALISRFKTIPEDMQQFASDPHNRPWIAFIQHLKQTGESNLLALAEAIQNLFHHPGE